MRDAIPRSIPAEVEAEMTPAVRAFVQELLARIAELAACLNKTPQNSSLPPSSQHPHAKPAPAKPKSKNRPGGQPGHPKHERALVPTDQCEEVVTLKPTACRKCGRTLRGQRLRSPSASSLGIAGDQAACHRVPTSSSVLPSLP